MALSCRAYSLSLPARLSSKCVPPSCSTILTSGVVTWVLSPGLRTSHCYGIHATADIFGPCLPICLQVTAPRATYAPLVNFVSLNSTLLVSNLSWYSESTTQPVYPIDLYAAQRLARLGYLPTDGPPPSVYTGPGYGCVGWQKCCLGSGNASCPVCPIDYKSKLLCQGFMVVPISCISSRIWAFS
jgi:hypothetical protein